MREATYFFLLWHGDAAAPYQLDFQDPATSPMEGIYLLYLQFLLIIISVIIVVGWLLYLILTNSVDLNIVNKVSIFLMNLYIYFLFETFILQTQMIIYFIASVYSIV
jgi:heme/copper-type cytochrome/quinol oxidase subunit 2